MKQPTFKILAPALLLALTLCGACRDTNPNETTSNPSGNNNPSDDNRGNHANEPQAAPGTNYPGSGGRDSNQALIADTLHK